jgi:hypothetical protein
MFKLFSIILANAFVATFIHAQTETPTTNFYISAGLSISNSHDTTFSYSSYPALEFGFMRENFSLGLVAGRSNLSGFRQDEISNYWYELKAAVYVPIGKFDGYALLGIGNYIATKQVFIEYGLGVAYAWDHWGVFAQASNWDGTWYATPGVSYTF